MYKIQTYDHIANSGLDIFPRDKYEIASEIGHPDALLLRSHNLHTQTLPETLLAIGRAGAGVNNIPVEKMTQQGVPVFNAPGANANAVKELVLAGMLIAQRHICQAWEFVGQLEGDDAALNQQVEKQKKQFVGKELFGKTLGVIGLGNIGVKIANAALALGMNVISYDTTITVSNALQLSCAVRQADSLDQLLRQSNFVTIHVPLLDSTRHLINASRLQIMPVDAVLLNFSRDGIVDNAALVQHLAQGKLAAYVCDFPSQALQHQSRVICLPHLGASTEEAEENCAVMVAQQLRDYLEHGNISNAVNFPTVRMERDGVARLTIVNANVPNMVSQISAKLGNAGINIVNLINQSRGQIAYTMLDLASTVDAALLQEIGKIEGVIRWRLIA